MATTFKRVPAKCKGLKGDALLDCLDMVEATSAKTKHAARVLAGYSGVAGDIEGPAATRGALGGANRVMSGSNPVHCRIIGYHNAKFGRMWNAFLNRNTAGRKKYKAPIDTKIQALQKAIDHLNEENSIGAKIEKFFTSPLTLITAAIAAYTTMGASLGATVASIVKDDDSIEAAIKKLQVLQKEYTEQSLKWFWTFFPSHEDEYFPVGSRLSCSDEIGSFVDHHDGTQPIHRNFKLWLEEEF